MSKAIYSLLLVSMIALSMSTVCRDGSTCPGTSTCCLTPAGVGCCPYENAYCCADGLHCCPSGYYCNNNQCQRASENGFELFLATEPVKVMADLHASTPAPQIKSDLGFPSITDIVKCVGDIQPVIAEVVQIVNALKEGNTDAAVAILPQLALDGTHLVTDCAKVIQSAPSAPSSSVFLDVAFPSVKDIIKCVSDLKPVITEVSKIVEDIKNGDIDGAIKVLPQLALDGLAMINDCAKVVTSMN